EQDLRGRPVLLHDRLRRRLRRARPDGLRAQPLRLIRIEGSRPLRAEASRAARVEPPPRLGSQAFDGCARLGHERLDVVAAARLDGFAEDHDYGPGALDGPAWRQDAPRTRDAHREDGGARLDGEHEAASLEGQEV